MIPALLPDAGVSVKPLSVKRDEYVWQLFTRPSRRTDMPSAVVEAALKHFRASEQFPDTNGPEDGKPTPQGCEGKETSSAAMKTTWKANPDRHDAGERPEYFTCKALSHICVKTNGKKKSLTEQAVRKRAEREEWDYTLHQRHGRPQRRFAFEALPEDVQMAIREYYGELPGKNVAAAQIREWNRATQKQKDGAINKLMVIKAWRGFCEANSGRAGKEELRGEFVERFKRVQEGTEKPMQGLDWETCRDVEDISVRSLHTWERLCNDGGPAALIDRRGGKKGATRIPEEQRDFILTSIAHNPNLRPARIHELLDAKFNGKAVCSRTVRNFLSRKRKEEPGVFCFLNSPDDYRSNFELALGDASEKATHFMHYVEVDSTNGEIQCSDGKRYNICGLIDIFSRKAKFVVTPTSNSWAIAALLWQTILDWGIPEILIRDRGKDYASKHISRGLLSVGTKVIELPPFKPQKKPHIERVFRTLTHGLFEILPGYLGHNVAERKAIESRKSFADRLLKKNQEPVELGLTQQELQTAINNWTEQVYHQRRHSSLGAPPNARAASDPNRPRRIEDREVLAILLSRSETRIVGKKGLRYDSFLYWDDPEFMDHSRDSLANWVGRSVVIRLDMGDAGRLFCFDPETEAFICQARDMAISGITVAEKIAAKKRARKANMKRVAAMKALAEANGDPLAEEIERIKRDKGSIFNLPVGEPVQGNPFVDAANAAAGALETGREEGRGKNPGEDVFEKTPSPGPPPQKLSVPESDNPNVIRLPLPEPEEVDLSLVTNPITTFELLRMAQRARRLSERETAWAKRTSQSWGFHAQMCAESYSEKDRIWLAEIDPDQFNEYLRVGRPMAAEDEPKVARLPVPEPGEMDLSFEEPIELFGHYRRKMQQEALTAKEEAYVQNNALREDGEGWLSFAAENWTTWNSEEQEWILRMVPDHLRDDFEAKKLEERHFASGSGGYT